MSERKAAIRESLMTGHDKLLKVLDKIEQDEAILTRKVWGENDEDWTVRDLIAHLATASNSMLRLGHLFAEGKDPVPADFDRDRWNRRNVEKQVERSAAELIQMIKDKYDGWLVFLDEVDENALDNRGRHGSGRIVSIEELFEIQANHEAEHAAQIQNLLD